MAKISYYLDTRRHKDQPVPLRIAIRNKNTVAYITMNETILPSQWDAENGCLKSYPKNKKLEHPDKARLDNFLRRHLLDIEDIARRLPYNLSAREMRRRILMALGGNDTEPTLFVDIYKRKMELCKRDSTRGRYQTTLNSIRLHDKQINTKTFEDLDEEWMLGYIKFLRKRDNCDNTIVSRFEHLKSVFNWAKKHRITTADPFLNLDIHMVETRKRSLLPDQLRELFTIDLSKYYPGEARRKRVQTYVDIFKLMFFLRGISFIDLCMLTKSSYENGRIYYNRSKTSTLYSIKVEPEAAEIINKYKGKKHLLFILDENKTYTIYLKTVNSNLRNLGIDKGKGKALFPGLTTYWARHSWATAATELEIPVETTSAGLGHKIGSRVTSIYIRYNQKKVDDANRQIIDYILYNKRAHDEGHPQP